MSSTGSVHLPRASRRLFAASILCAGTIAATVPATTSERADPACAVWVVRNALTTRSAWSDALASVERVGCDRIYLQVSGRWDAYFPSTVFPPPATRPRGERWADDPFGRAVAQARERGIEVHAWVNALLAWSAPDPPAEPGHVWFRDRDWFVRDREGRSIRDLDREELDARGLPGEGWFLDPGREEVRSELRRFVLEVSLRYPVDGIHLDYIRYPTGWVPHRGAEEVTALVALIRDDLRTVRPDAALSAAVMPVPEIARRSFGQDWSAWLTRGLVDEAVPMVYRESPASVLRTVEGWPAEIPLERVRVGVRVDRLTPREARDAMSRLAGKGAAGVALFSHVLLGDVEAWRRTGAIARGR